MAKIFITYADDRYIMSGHRLVSMARKSKLFDQVRLFTPKDLPPCILCSPALAYPRGGGFWLWKPYIINYALSRALPGDVVYYADAGCYLNADSDEWQMYDEILKDYNSIIFQYREGYKYPWGKQNVDSVKIRHWMKPAMQQYFTEAFGSDKYLDYDSVWSGFVIVKNIERDSNVLTHNWLSISLFHPEIIVNPFGREYPLIDDKFNVHRHDQAVLSALAYFLKDKEKIMVLPETSESRQGNPAIIGQRWRQGKMSTFDTIKYHLYRILHK